MLKQTNYWTWQLIQWTTEPFCRSVSFSYNTSKSVKKNLAKLVNVTEHLSLFILQCRSWNQGKPGISQLAQFPTCPSSIKFEVSGVPPQSVRDRPPPRSPRAGSNANYIPRLLGLEKVSTLLFRSNRFQAGGHASLYPAWAFLELGRYPRSGDEDPPLSPPPRRPIQWSTPRHQRHLFPTPLPGRNARPSHF